MNPIDFIHDVTWGDLPNNVRQQARRCLLDTIGVAIVGRETELSQIIYNHAARTFGGDDAPLWFDGRRVSAAGASLALGMTIDSVDLHDSCRPIKGHAGVAQVPAALTTLGFGHGTIDGQELLTTLVMAYDIATRTGTAQHNTCCDYHTSGSWNAVAAAAIVARRMGLNREQTRHALGIAEYHGPRSQMMRAIDYPTMVKDGSGWGAMAGVSAGLLAADGFTGAPAITVEADKTKHDIGPYWESLGSEWQILNHFFKPYAVCYWAQAAIAGAVNLQREHHIDTADITGIQVYTFHESARLAMRYPTRTDEAQYSLPFPVAGALVHGKLYLDELQGDNLYHPEVLRLSGLVELIEDDYFNERFPEQRLSRVVITTREGRTYDSGVTWPLWDLREQATDAELRDNSSCQLL
ncbi:MAG: hypothetical protein ETSY1_17980, partial [Candidatus Entotheonella factor]